MMGLWIRGTGTGQAWVLEWMTGLESTCVCHVPPRRLLLPTISVYELILIVPFDSGLDFN